MTLPLFPSQDLAKLVLGYLAEEQLMTAYDEFLQASPYLDALRNEYDRIFMNSLKNILAEYRAVKIYVETCKPTTLRRRLFGCANLLEVVKYLVQHIDVNKVQAQEAAHRISKDNVDTTIPSRTISCDECNSLKLPSCVCRSKPTGTCLQSTSNVAASTTSSSVETTLLEDLPGNSVRKKHMKVLEKDSKVFLSSSSCEQSVDQGSRQQSDGVSVASLEQNFPSNDNNTQINQDSLALHSANNFPVEPVARIDPKEKIEELNDILNIVSAITDRRCNSGAENVESNSNRVSTASSFQDFETGVNGGDNGHNTVPDSSTSENLSTQAPITKEPNTINAEEIQPKNSHCQEVPKPQIFYKIGTVKSNEIQVHSELNHLANVNNLTGFKPYGIIRPKPNEQRVTILSDVKVDKTLPNDSNHQQRMQAMLKNATSTPVQTILINGTPAYRHEPRTIKSCNYTKDEIMAMPTIILVPNAGSQIPPSIQSRGACNRTLKPSTAISSTVNHLGPLTIDVSTNAHVNSNNDIRNNNFPSLNTQQEESSSSNVLIKTVDGKNASVPKYVADTFNKDTPHALPPTRKSSSTPRRSSHVRVLDFTTPRRILQETINEHDPNENSSPVETITSKSPSLHTFVHTVTGENIDSSEISACTKENNDTVISQKKNNWDADLRALAVANEKVKGVPVAKPKPKPRTSKNKKLSLSDKNQKNNVIEEKKPNSKLKSTSKNKTSKMKRKSDDIIEELIIVVDDLVPVPVKPTINIIAGPDWSIPSKEDDDDKNKNKSNNDNLADTPEMDRTSLQNVIGAKLNISDLLETPYKQALYDIQMGTPRFLGPDLPDDPMSDIKIMNIPTPRFLNTPKPPQATPSSYSSRPTDYSSGGSYYKPDDQDYMPVEDLEYPVTESTKVKQVSIASTSTVSENISKDSNVRSSRPVRKCTKNVSYYNSPCVNTKTKEVDEKSELASPCSEAASAVQCSTISLCDSKVDEEMSKSVKCNTLRQTKTETTKKNNTFRKRKTPVKKDTKTFMKIKPRRPTPTKVGARSKRKTSEPHGRKRTNSKEKHVNITPNVTSAPTKSRRKSSTPRKLPSTKTFVSESSGHDSPELIAKNKPDVTRDSSVSRAQESDTDQLALRWSDDGSQDAKSGEPQVNASVNESDDITKIQEYIAKSYKTVASNHESSLHIDLVKRGFDIETAKIIERDLLDTPPYPQDKTRKSIDDRETKENETLPETTQQSDSTSTNLRIEKDEDDCDEIELSIHECNEDTENYITCSYDDTKATPKIPQPKLKDKFSMEVCIDDGVSIRLRATPFSVLHDQDPQDIIETEMAVSSISNIDKLYTPMKDSIKAQCFEIFDSTLTSLDTPLKPHSPKKKEHEVPVTEIILEVEEVEVKEKTETKKRKRLQSGNASDDSTNENKRTKPEPQYLLNSANIQNIDIETVLYKLHGP